jgi:competence protein CoiA
MQWIALAEQERITADQAKKGVTYLCPECASLVRMRSGPHRRPHFYHITENRFCRQNGKTAAHLETQLAIQRSIPEVILEYACPQIQRIADLFWPERKLVFEVQCSSISYEEIANRTEDYQSIGLEIVWILHDRRYNQRWLSSAEKFLIDKSHYFSSIDGSGSGTIYDQFFCIEGSCRVSRGPRLPISLAHPYPMSERLIDSDWPLEAIRRAKKRELGFSGDFVDWISQNEPTHWERIKFLEMCRQSSSISKGKSILSFLRDGYLSGLNAFLKKHSDTK